VLCKLHVGVNKGVSSDPKARVKAARLRRIRSSVTSRCQHAAFTTFRAIRLSHVIASIN
jgi:hypothetical protein